MSCSTFVESRVHFNNPDEFKTHLRRFIVGLWDVKTNQLKGQIDKAEQEKKQKEAREKEAAEMDKANSLFVADKKAKRVSLKHRDLVNPQRKKRKKNGAKLGSGYE